MNIPSALPHFYSGLKVAVTFSIIGAAIGEWLGAQAGLGYFSRRMMTQFDAAGVFAPIVILSALGDFILYYCSRFRKTFIKVEENRMKKWFAIGLSLMLVLMLAACGQDKENKAGDSKKLKDVTIMLDWYPNAVHSFIYAAQEKGYFKKEGLNVKVQFPANPTDSLNLAACAGKLRSAFTISLM